MISEILIYLCLTVPVSICQIIIIILSGFDYDRNLVCMTIWTLVSKRYAAFLISLLLFTIIYPSMETLHSCKHCSVSFTSRNKLFQHIPKCTSASEHENLEKVNSAKVGVKDDDDDDDEFNASDAAIRGKIQVIQEDLNWYRVILKPQGMATMGLSGHETLINSDAMLLDGAISNQLNYKKAVPCHRLDRATGGLVVCSKSKEAESSIMQSFQKHEVKKRYCAIVMGRLEPPSGTIDTPLSGQAATTRYEVTHYTRSKQYETITTVNLWPITGRKHQLRKHLAGVGHPIIGDSRYCSALHWPRGPAAAGLEGVMFLFSLEVRFPHKGLPPVPLETTPLPAEEDTTSSYDVTTPADNKMEPVDTASLTSITGAATTSTATTTAAVATTVQPLSSDDVATEKGGAKKQKRWKATNKFLAGEVGYPVIHVEIPEPALYEDFRRMQAEECV